MTNITQDLINESLNSAIENGYELDLWSAEDIAVDLCDYDSRFENIDSQILLPFIKSWKESRGKQ